MGATVINAGIDEARDTAAVPGLGGAAAETRRPALDQEGPPLLVTRQPEASRRLAASLSCIPPELSPFDDRPGPLTRSGPASCPDPLARVRCSFK